MIRIAIVLLLTVVASVSAQTPDMDHFKVRKIFAEYKRLDELKAQSNLLAQQGWNSPARNRPTEEVVLELDQSPIQAPDQHPRPLITKGEQGPPGAPGRNGADGKNGADGLPGPGLTDQEKEAMVVAVFNRVKIDVKNEIKADPTMRGADGKGATIAIGSVSAGPMAAIVNKGTPTDAIWDITLPQSPVDASIKQEVVALKVEITNLKLRLDAAGSAASGILYFTVKGNTWPQLDEKVNRMRNAGQPFIMIWLDPTEAVSVRDVPRIYNINTKQSFTGLPAVTEYLGTTTRKELTNG